MAGSRIEKFGTIFSRVRGLLRAGAIQEVDKPVWYDVYEAFPPKVEPDLDRADPKITVKAIIYPEDFVRREFYHRFGNPDVVNLKSEEKTTCQKFVEKYFELQSQGVEPSGLFEKTTEHLRVSGDKFLRSKNNMQKQNQLDERKTTKVVTDINS